MIANEIKVINDLRKAASTADAIYLAGDPDREGEAICAHLEEILGNPRQYANLVEPKEDGDEPAKMARKNPLRRRKPKLTLSRRKPRARNPTAPLRKFIA